MSRKVFKISPKLNPPTTTDQKAAKFEGVSDWYNIYIISLFSFVDAFQFNLFMYSFWPFVNQLDPTLTATFIGLIMAFSGVGEAVSAPIFGLWTNKIGRVNPPLIASLVTSMIANLSYACMNAMPNAYILLLSRFFSGVGSGNRSVYLAYTAARSTKSDRTQAMALSSGGALVGLMLGPSVQVFFTWIGSHGLEIGGTIRISMYTAPALLAFLINVFCVLLLRFFLDDRLDCRGQEEDTLSQANVTEDEESHSSSTVRLDLIAVVVCIMTRAARMLVTSNIDSIGSPYAQLMFNFDDEEVLNYNALAQIGIGFLTSSMLMIQAFTNYTKWISERPNCMIGMSALLVFYLLTFPYPFIGNAVHCPVDQNNQSVWSWCSSSLRAPNVYFYYFSYMLIFGIALPCLNNSLQSIYSLILGNIRQGTMQGINQAIGSVSRIFGPIIMSTTFTLSGPIVNWTIEIFTLGLFLGIWMVTYRRLVPAKDPESDDGKCYLSSQDNDGFTKTKSIRY